MNVSSYTSLSVWQRYEFIAPYDSFKALNGWVIIAIANDALWNRFVACTAGSDGMPAELSKDIFNTNSKRLQNHTLLKELIEQWTIKHPIEEIVELLLENRV